MGWGGWTLFGSGPALRKQTLPNNLQFHIVYSDVIKSKLQLHIYKVQVATDIAYISENCNSTSILPSHPTIAPRLVFLPGN